MTDEAYINHEVRLRMLEELNREIHDSINELEVKIDTRFLLIIGLVIASIFIPVVLHYLRLT
jgi:hypothetical protein